MRLSGTRAVLLGALAVAALSGCSGSNETGEVVGERGAFEAAARPTVDAPLKVPDPPAESPTPIQPKLVPGCVPVPGLDPTSDGFVQVSQALVEASGVHALQWICREHDWRMRLERCRGDCQSAQWEDVAELRLPEVQPDEVLVFGLEGCSNADGDALVGLAERGSGPVLDRVRRAWRISLAEPYGFREIEPGGVRCQNPDYGL